MPSGLKRFHASGQSRFLTLCCYHRRLLFETASSKEIFEVVLERVRNAFGLCVYGSFARASETGAGEAICNTQRAAREGFVRQLSCPTQAKERLEWATSQIKVNGDVVYLYTPARNDLAYLTYCLVTGLGKVIGQQSTPTQVPHD